MRVIAFVTQKGGSGKSTLAFCCAVAASEGGRSALILDSDPQGTAEAWYQDREVETPRLAKVSGLQLDDAVEKRASTGSILCSSTPPAGTSRRPRQLSGPRTSV